MTVGRNMWPIKCHIHYTVYINKVYVHHWLGGGVCNTRFPVQFQSDFRLEILKYVLRHGCYIISMLKKNTLLNNPWKKVTCT